MSASNLFADLQFKIECHQIVLTQAGGGGTQIGGPGEIWQDERGILNFKLFADAAGYQRSIVHMSQPRTAGRLLQDDDFFNLQAQEYGNPVWSAARIFPATRGGLQAGIVHGEIHELTTRTPLPHITPTQDHVKVIFRGKLDFPCNQGTETITRVAGREIRSNSAFNVAFAEDGAFRFQIRHEENHTSVSLHLPLGSLTTATSSRIHEAFQFILGQQLTVMAVETWSGGEEIIQLRSPWASRGDGKIQPPLQFRRHDEGGHVWRMFCDYFRRIHPNTSDGWHPISTHLGRVIESSAASLDTELLALGVAVEGLAGESFSHLAPVSPAFLAELNSVEAALRTMTLSEQARNRLEGSIRAMRSARNSDVIRAFLTANNLPNSLYQAWSRIRNASAHGSGIRDRDLENLIGLKDDVLSLLYSLTLAAITYTGPRSEYSQDGWPTTNWPVTAAPEGGPSADGEPVAAPAAG